MKPLVRLFSLARILGVLTAPLYVAAAPVMRTLTLGAYTTPREAYGKAIIPAFQRYWKQRPVRTYVFRRFWHPRWSVGTRRKSAPARPVFDNFAGK